jgi:hypothetical protein
VLYWLSTPFMGFWWLLEFNRTDRAHPSRFSSSGPLSLPAICTIGRAHDTGNGHTSHALLATWSLTNPCCWHPTRFQLARMAPQRTPIGFFPLRRFSWLSPLPRVCLTRYVPLSGFLNLLAVCSSANREALFHASYAHGVLPSEVSPHVNPSSSRSRSPHAVGRACPPAVSALWPADRQTPTRSICQIPSRLQGFPLT